MEKTNKTRVLADVYMWKNKFMNRSIQFRKIQNMLNLNKAQLKTKTVKHKRTNKILNNEQN